MVFLLKITEHYLTYICYFVLFVNIFETIKLTCLAKTETNIKKGSLTLAYTLPSVIIIGLTIKFLPRFKIGFLQLASNISLPQSLEQNEAFLFFSISITSIFVFSSFLCNCSRSVYYLNKLDQGINIFEHKKIEFNNNLPSIKQSIEYILITLCALAFVWLETCLTKLRSDNFLHTTQIGIRGLTLYSLLLIWMCFHFYFHNNKMKYLARKNYSFIIIFTIGLIISLFIAVFGDGNPNNFYPFIFSISLILVLSALMLYELVKSAINSIFHFFEKWLKEKWEKEKWQKYIFIFGLLILILIDFKFTFSIYY